MSWARVSEREIELKIEPQHFLHIKAAAAGRRKREREMVATKLERNKSFLPYSLGYMYMQQHQHSS